MQRLSRAGVVSIVAATANITAVARRHRGVAQLLRVPGFQVRTMAAAATAVATAAPAAGGGAGGGAGVGGGTAADASAATSVPQFCDIGANLLDTMFQGEYVMLDAYFGGCNLLSHTHSNVLTGTMASRSTSRMWSRCCSEPGMLACVKSLSLVYQWLVH